MSAPTERIQPPCTVATPIQLRKVLRLGSSYAVTVDPTWAREHHDPDRPYFATSVHADGTFRVADPRGSTPTDEPTPNPA